VPAFALAGLFLAPPVAFSGPVASGCRTALDTSLDNKSDLGHEKTVAPNEGLVRLSLMDGVTQTSFGFPLVLNSNQTLIGYGSFDGSGRAQLLAINSAAPNQGLLRIIEVNGLSVTGSQFPALIPAGFDFVGVADMNGDGADDIVFVKTASPNVGLLRVTLMNTDYTVQSTQFPGFLAAGFDILGLADENGDGRADVIGVKTASPNTGLYRVFLMGANAASFTGSQFPGNVPAGFAAIGVGCFNGDDVGDMLLVKTGAPNLGLVRIQMTVSGATGFSTSTFPFFVPSDFAIQGIGNYDGTNGDDSLARKQGAPNQGLDRMFLLNADASAVMMTGFPNSIPTTFTEVGGVGSGLP
jgi:hypothetical protein